MSMTFKIENIPVSVEEAAELTDEETGNLLSEIDQIVDSLLEDGRKENFTLTGVHVWMKSKTEVDVDFDAINNETGKTMYGEFSTPVQF